MTCTNKHFWAEVQIEQLLQTTHSTDFEVHRNWLAITHSLPINKWYVDETSQWTLDYPPFFAYFERMLAYVAYYVDKEMLNLHKLNYNTIATIYFQRCSVILMDFLYAIGVYRCLRVSNVPLKSQQYLATASLLLFNVGLLFIDHIHFQYNGFLFGILLLSISYMLEERYVLSAFIFAILLNFKHIFLYIAPAYAIYLLKFYCLAKGRNKFICITKLLVFGLIPFVISFAPFHNQMEQVLKRLFPFKRGLTHAYWAPNFWALYNVGDKVAAKLLGITTKTGPTTSSGLVKEFAPLVLPNITPRTTFVLTLLSMLPIMIKLLAYTPLRDAKATFLRAIVICSCSAFMFGWHVHEKAILMSLIPLCLLFHLYPTDAKHAFLLSVVGYFSLFPLLFETSLLVLRYALYLFYMFLMYGQMVRLYTPLRDYKTNLIENCYIYGFVLLPIYEHILSVNLNLHLSLPFLPLLLTSVYCALGVTYFFISYYLYTLGIKPVALFKSFTKIETTSKTKTKSKTRTQQINGDKVKLK
ncbi:probable dolichyl pyrophosphate Glc1Man9GlcNAc2 alpha-1,3-glucosyltransferase isoform X3 [Ceratitis capitata]|uniref:probable dolichyl pyrophosphate Glc1Man9GlcNAc2 alpha-1,3-glucosyltransferase isoform X3 n=1 Tax=Ceratitis capitata TaxID=7213 RepID=UPI000A1054EB|nr:probable dolichyl pyrophosphate Glc1Man9GlcNAc2 alpha-1,3-glucosyltransferase isoform X3 [Ceratitis capitata]